MLIVLAFGGCSVARATERSGDVSVLAPPSRARAAPVVIALRGEVDEEASKDIRARLDEANESGATSIVVRIHSGGGSVPDGFDIAQAIEASAAPVTCVVDGEAASMAAYILQSCAVRIMTKRSMIMFHEPSMGGRFSGQPTEWQSAADWIRAMTDAMVEHCARRMSVGVEEFHRHIAGGSMWWMAWRAAFRARAVDRVVDTFADALR